MKNRFLFLLVGLGAAARCLAQCPTAAPSTPCCVGTLLTSSTNAIGGSGDYYLPVGTTLNNATLSGFYGNTLRVYGDLTLTTLGSVNNATLVVEPGGKLTLKSNFQLNNGANLTNYGTLVLEGGLGVNAALVNKGSLSVTGSTVFNSNSQVQNDGTVQVNALTFNQTSYCLGASSSTTATDVTNNATNALSVVSGQACLRFTGNYTSYNSLTSSAVLQVCKAAGATETAFGNNYGAATVLTNCTSCASALPVELSYFGARQLGQSVQVSWVTASERNSAYFVVEKSADGRSFADLTERIAAAGQADGRNEYACNDPLPTPGLGYYRLRQVDADGATVHSRPVAVAFQPDRLSVSVAPNPAAGQFRVQIASPDSRPLRLRVFTAQGREVLCQTPVTDQLLDLSALPDGLYVLHIQHDGQTEFVRLLKAQP